MRLFPVFFGFYLVAISKAQSYDVWSPVQCDDGATQLLTPCSPEFQRCRCNQWITSRCPDGAIFDGTSQLCLFDQDCNAVAPTTTPSFPTEWTTARPSLPALPTTTPGPSDQPAPTPGPVYPKLPIVTPGPSDQLEIVPGPVRPTLAAITPGPSNQPEIIPGPVRPTSAAIIPGPSGQPQIVPGPVYPTSATINPGPSYQPQVAPGPVRPTLAVITPGAPNQPAIIPGPVYPTSAPINPGPSDQPQSRPDFVSPVQPTTFAPVYPTEATTVNPVYQESQAAPGLQESQIAPGFQESQTAPGSQESQTAPGFQESQTAPGFQESQTAPGFQESQTAPGFQEGQTAPGLQEDQSAPGYGVQADSAYGAQSAPSIGYPVNPYLLSNPFYVPRRYNRHHHRRGHGHHSHHHGWDDGFESWDVFPRSRVHRKKGRHNDYHHKDSGLNHKTSARHDAFDDTDDLFAKHAVASVDSHDAAAPDFLTKQAVASVDSHDASADSPSVPRPDDTIQGSGYVDSTQSPTKSEEDDELLSEYVVRRKRSSQITGQDTSKAYCINAADNSIFSLGFCAQNFVICKASKEIVAACPAGDLFDFDQSRCVPSAACGNPNVDICATPTSLYSTMQTATDLPAEPTESTVVSWPVPTASKQELVVEVTTPSSVYPAASTTLQPTYSKEPLTAANFVESAGSTISGLPYPTAPVHPAVPTAPIHPAVLTTANSIESVGSAIYGLSYPTAPVHPAVPTAPVHPAVLTTANSIESVGSAIYGLPHPTAPVHPAVPTAPVHPAVLTAESRLTEETTVYPAETTTFAPMHPTSSNIFVPAYPVDTATTDAANPTEGTNMGSPYSTESATPNSWHRTESTTPPPVHSEELLTTAHSIDSVGSAISGLPYPTAPAYSMDLTNPSEATKIVYVTVSSDPSEFCKGRGDSLYRDPKACSGVIQCHNEIMFQHVGCPSGLVFNEERQECDYRSTVPECAQADHDDPAATNECKGAHHGAYLPDDGNCSIFYRCVWDRLVQMNCPNGTVFNPTLSVCDWPANVPKCNSVTGTPSADAAVPASLY